MTRVSVASLAVPCVFLAASLPASAAENASTLVNQYCVACHNKKLNTAGISLEGLDPNKADSNADAWEKVIRKLNAKEMPPAGMPHPSPAAEKQFTDWLESELDRAAMANPNPGHPTIHRLNRNEYSNAVRDLLALDAKPGDKLPLDDSGYGFDNIGDVLSLSPMLLERYLSVARSVAALAVGNTDVKPVVDIFSPVKEARAKGRPSPLSEQISEDLPFGSAGGMSIRYTFPVDAEYVFKIKLPAPAPAFGETAVPVGQTLEFRTPVKAGIREVGLTFMQTGAVPEVLPNPGRGGAGRGGARMRSMGQIDLRVDGARVKLFEAPEGDNGPGFSDLSIGGPYNITGPGDTASRRRIFICKTDDDACARKILSTLGRRAFRRELADTDVNSLLAVYRAGRRNGSFDRGIEMALRAMLVSPDFLFRVERDPAGAAPGTVTASTISSWLHASRFFCGAVFPTTIAESGGAGETEGSGDRERQVRRMLDDPKSEAFVSNFAGQCLYLRNLAPSNPIRTIFPEFDEQLSAGVRAGDRAVLQSDPAGEPAGHGLAGRELYLSQSAAGGALRDPRHLRNAVPASNAHRSEPRRTAGTGQHSDGDVVSESDVGGAAREMGAGKSFGDAAAAPAARTFRRWKPRQGRQAIRCGSRWSSIGPIRFAQAATRAWIRSASRSRTTTVWAPGATKIMARSSMLRASFPMGPYLKDPRD